MEDNKYLESSVLQQDPERIEEVIAQERGKLMSFIRKRVANLDDAEDILQEVFAQLSYTGLDSVEQLSAWLFTVARNKITDLYRKRKPITIKLDTAVGVEGESYALTLAEILPDLSQSPDVLLARQVLAEALEEALEELPREQREVFVMHEFEHLSFKEIAKRIQLPINTLISRKHYAIKHLRKRLLQLYQEL